MRKKIKIYIWILVIWTMLLNLITISNSIVFIDNEKSEILKEQFNLPESSKVFATIIPKNFFRPSFKMVYIDDIILIQDTGKLGEANNNAFVILPDMIDDDISQYVWILNILHIIIIIVLIIIYRAKC